jgi:transcriptional regulator with XRE-family HTH domain
VPVVRSPHAIDKHVGARLRMRRLMLGMSQEALGRALGLTFQQVQKYEKGANRIGASRLRHIAQALQVPIGFFFEGAPPTGAGRGADAIAGEASYVSDFMATSDGLALAKAFMKISKPAVRRALVAVVEQIAATR